MNIVHASPGFGSKMTEGQVLEFLKSKLNLLLGTVDDNGQPYVHPVWFFFEDGKFFIETSKTAKKVQNIQNNKNAYFCVDDETIPYKGVRGKGTVLIHDEITVRNRVQS